MKKQKVLSNIFPKEIANKIVKSEKKGASIISTCEELSILDHNKKKLQEIADLTKSLDNTNSLLVKKENVLNSKETSNRSNDLSKNEILDDKIIEIKGDIKELNNKISQIGNEIKTKRSELFPDFEPKKTPFYFIISAINNYLVENKGGASDFHLMKDIVDRNCDNVEEEISTLTPVPLYLGLIGTMVGVIIGVAFFDVAGLADAAISIKDTGISELLGGVAIAMISSIVGIGLSTGGSLLLKKAKTELNQNKNSFFSWLQGQLLPSLSDNATSAIQTLQKNLSSFNSTFSSNIKEMRTVFSQMSSSHANQLELMKLVSKMDVSRMATANIEVYEKLKNCTDEIGELGQFLENSNDYLSNVQELNNKLDEHEKRYEFFEKASKFYSKHENWLAENYDEANRKLEDVVGKYNKSIQDVFEGIKCDIEGKRQNIGSFIDKQNAALQSSAGDLEKIVKALAELGNTQKAIIGLEKATLDQNRKLDSLANAIIELAKAKNDGTPVKNIGNKPKMTLWKRIMMLGGVVLGGVVLIGLISLIWNFVNTYFSYYF